METKLDFLIGANTILDSNMLLEYQESEMRAYLKVKNQQFDEKILVYDKSRKQSYLQNELVDIIDTYYQSYYELMDQTFVAEDQMDFMDVALGIACGLRIYHLYAPAFLEIRKMMNLHYINQEAVKPFGWHVGEIKFTDRFKYLFELAENQFGKMVYTYDGYNFPQEVFDILQNELKCIEATPHQIKYTNWMANAWTYKQ